MSFDVIAIQSVNNRASKQGLLEDLNMSLVSLGVYEGKNDNEEELEFVSEDITVESKGFGLVRGIDADKRLCYILTPLAAEVKTVNCLTLGTIHLPKAIYLSPGHGGAKIQTQLVKKSLYVEQRSKDTTPLNSEW